MNYEELTDREIDALVAEKVKGERFFLERRGEYTLAVGMRDDGREPWFGVQKPQPEKYTEVSATKAQETGFFGRGIKRYSHDISSAFEVVEAMRERGYGTEIHIDPSGVGVVVNKHPGEWCEEGAGENEGTQVARCICIAALRALDE